MQVIKGQRDINRVKCITRYFRVYNERRLSKKKKNYLFVFFRI